MAYLTAHSIPPLFSLAQADGSRFDLAAILGRTRILIAFHPSAGWLRDIAERQEALRDYELQVLALATPQVLAAAPPASDCLRIGAAGTSILDDFGVGAGEVAVFLVGKDRGIKRVYHGEAYLSEVLSLIDTMPMRRAEVAHREE